MVFLTAPHYVLGEIEADHTTIANLRERAGQFRLAFDAKTWGWGSFHRTQHSPGTMAVQSASETLRAASVDPWSVDLLLLCSTRFPHGADSQGLFVQGIMTGLGLRNAAFLGVAMLRCANLLAAIQLADMLVAAGRYRRVLVVTADRIEDETVRLESFALFSDGAASCLVHDGADAPVDYEVVSCAAAHDPPAVGGSNEISADLSRQVNDALLKPLDMTLGQVSGLMHGNVFTPIVMMKELQAGFSPAQLYLQNINRIGHCFAADPLINLVDQAGAGRLRDGDHYLLAASVPGSRIGVLLKKSVSC